MTPPVNLALAQRLEHVEALNTAGYAQALKQWQPQSAAATLPIGAGLAVFTRSEFPMNRAVGLGLVTDPGPAEVLQTVEAFYQSHGVPSQVMVCPFTEASLLRELGRRGYFAQQFYNVHVRPITLEDANWAEPAAEPALIQVTLVAAPDFDLWAQTNISTSREWSTVLADDVWLAVCQVAVRRPQVTGFIAWVDGEPAGSAALSIHAGVATLFSAGTRLRFRRRGVQTPLLHARLAEAQRQGCDLAHITTSPGSDSQRNVQRRGFGLIYQRMTMCRE